MAVEGDVRDLSIPGVSEAVLVRGPGIGPDAAPELLIEAPHGASRRAHFDALRDGLRSPLPDDLEAFFFVNTDVGSFETALRVAERVVHAGGVASGRPPAVLVMRALIPRTFIDCNRVAGATGGALTPAVPDYITDAADVDLLSGLHARYREVSEEAFVRVCGRGHRAVILHTYAPRSIHVDRIDGSIVDTLRAAYAPGAYARWPRRPDVDVISELDDGTLAAPRPLVEALRARYAAIGVEVTENATYRLMPATLGRIHSERYPGRVLCMEISRELLADPFSPFEEMTIGEEKVNRMAKPLASALLDIRPGESPE